MTLNGRWKSPKSFTYAVVVLGAALTMASAPAADAPASAASSGWPLPGAGLSLAGLRFGHVRVAVPAGQISSSELEGVFCTSAANCWAVGDHSSGRGPRLNLALHWTGRHWSGVHVPNPGGSRAGDDNELFAVRCTSASNCWAVGDTEKPKQAELDEALHWNGKKWVAVPTPTPAGILSGDINDLVDVTCASAISCWAVGSYGTSTVQSEVALNQALHWNGKAWSLVHTPNPGGTSSDHANALNAVRCASARDCWAAGSYGTIAAISESIAHNEMLHWNGRRWAKVTVPDPAGTAKGSINDIDGLACTSAVNCFAAGLAANLGGTPETTKVLNEILRWNGKTWFTQAAPQPGGSGFGTDDALIGITCSSARNCWAVGSRSRTKAGTPTKNEALHWNGAQWSFVFTPNPGGTVNDDRSVLNSARCTTARNCWAVGVTQQSGGQDVAQRLHWTGKKWFVG